jgi:hypothetical protein
MFVIGGKAISETIPIFLTYLQQGDLKHQIDFRSVYANLLTSKVKPYIDGIKIKLLLVLF